jgi:hypothetical protein
MREGRGYSSATVCQRLQKVAPSSKSLRNAPYVGAFGQQQDEVHRQSSVAIYNVAVGESLTFARTMGLDRQQVWSLFATNPVVGTGVFRLRGKFMLDRQYCPPTMKVEVWQKDMQVIGDMARSVDCPLPLFTACSLYTTQPWRKVLVNPIRLRSVKFSMVWPGPSMTPQPFVSPML